ncbi:vWA domain-containing protein [Variovorax dokdonensis]|uniref:vWA domain-containing protein n=1 Tax=Variovorax dokdonensis TaxID=344883 RepID=UPI0036F3C572
MRPWIALLCVPLLGAGSMATADVVAPHETRWPQPARQTSWPMAVQTAPNFNAPSATHCMRPARMVEVPGGQSAPRAVDEAAPPVGMPRRDRAGDALFEKGARLESRKEIASGSAAPTPAPAPSAPAASAFADERAHGADSKPERQRQEEVVTAGMVDDNANFSDYLQFLRKYAQVPHRERNVRERYLLEVRTPAGIAVPDAEIALRADNGAAMWARTDSAGRAWIHPLAFDPQGSARYQVAARKNGREATAVLARGQKSAVELTLDAPPSPPRAQLDLVFLVDATGSMGDEIGKLRASLRSIADEVARLPSRPDLCFGLVAYRDRGDAFLLRRYDLSNDLAGFQSALDALRADGGGDYPEAMNEAFHDTLHNIDWRGPGATRLVVLLADAPPHLDYGGPQYDEDMMAALGKGIKVFSVGASGLRRQGEYVQRQIAQYTGGSFVFLTYQDARNPASGPGRETVHDVRNYSVQTLDKLIVKLVSDELAKLPAGNG